MCVFIDGVHTIPYLRLFLFFSTETVTCILRKIFFGSVTFGSQVRSCNIFNESGSTNFILSINIGL
jgi:hypothetical protein